LLLDNKRSIGRLYVGTRDGYVYAVGDA